jgi:Icc-related predicted phosphoesterase
VWFRRVGAVPEGEDGGAEATTSSAGSGGGASSSFPTPASLWARFFSDGWRRALFDGLADGLEPFGLEVERAVVDGADTVYVVAMGNATSPGPAHARAVGDGPVGNLWHVALEDWERRDAGGDHLVRLEDLAPGAEYEYTIGAASEAWEPLPEGRPTFTFRAWPAPPPKSGRKPSSGDGGTWARAWVLGDAGRGGGTPRRVRDAMLRHAAQPRGADAGADADADGQEKFDPLKSPAWDVTLALGDNAYSDGGEWEHTHHFFEVYEEINARVPVMPTMGNHEGHSSDLMEGTGPYYDAFELPTEGESGGVPSGHPSYYSFDFGDIHFVSIDSENHVPYNDETFFEWLEKDLEAAQSSAWRVAYFHHPPYSKGSHDSDDEWGLKKMRERLVPLLEEKRVEIVFTGHSHAYERSNLLGGLYEGSWKTDEHTKAEPEKAEPEKAEARSEARSKDKLRSGGKGAARLWQAPPETGWDEHDRLVKTDCGPLGGTLYVVAGSASQTGKGRINHKAMRYSTKSKGSALLSIMGNSKARIDFVNEGGEVEDVVELHKSGKGCLA